MTAPSTESLVHAIRGATEEVRATLLEHWPATIDRKQPHTWTPQDRVTIGKALDRLIGFDTDNDQRVLEQARASLLELCTNVWGELDADDRAAHVRAVCEFAKVGDLDTFDSIKTVHRTVERVQAGDLVVTFDQDDQWCVIHAGTGSTLEHRRAVTDMTESDAGGYACIVTVRHPTGAVWPATKVEGTAAHSIAKTVLAYTEKENKK